MGKVRLDLWHEYERETIGKSVIRFIKGLQAQLLPHEAEKTDEELAALEVGGEDAVRFAGWFYCKIARVPGLEGKVLTALDTGGFAAPVELLTVYHLDVEGGYWQIEGEVKDGLEQSKDDRMSGLTSVQHTIANEVTEQ